MTILTKLLCAFICSFAVTAIVGAVLVPALRKIKAGQMIREDGPVWHKKKQGTPTMGGLMFIAGILVSCFAVGFKELSSGNPVHIIVFVFALIYGAIGFLDDYEKLKKKQNLGLTAKQKFALQLVVAIVLIILLRRFGYVSPNVYIPFFGVTVPINEIVYYVLAAFIIEGCVNAVNITDGVDGLVTGVSIP
ncbi:MAG: phospho-N-acetylmuramoyl-pentapeptide-transferase, partial [Oscillospiraceae bacterium]|nr:phospho-N-acetylmuramoyl-pentapeptide-transferase [Oscillospiraceae bacterium]